MREAMSSSKVLTPEFLWAQRKDQVFITVNVPNVKKGVSVKLTDEGQIYFKGFGGAVGHEAEYLLDITLFKPIKADQSKYKITARSAVFRIHKADSGPYWDRLLKAEGRNVHCKIDWDNWKDEDEDEYSYGTQFGDSKDLQDMDFGSGASSSDDEEETDAPATAEDK